MPERRIVTVVFVDLVGYTALSSELDVEEVHVLIRPLMNGLRRICDDLGGLVPAIEGDGFMAVFGARQADPQDPERAVMASMRMQRHIQERRHAYGEGLPGLRVGVHVGEVLVAPSWEQHGFSVSGDVVNVASRLCDAAAPREVLATTELQALIPGDRWGEVRYLQLKNRAEQVSVVSLDWTGLDEPLREPSRPVRAALVGRGTELEQLEAASSSRLLQIVGESGVGKSRLVDEWLRTKHDALVLRGYCSSFDVDSDRSVARDLLADVPADVRAEALAQCDPEARALLLGLDAEHTAAEIARAVVQLLELVAQQHRVLVVVDDVQWASSGTVALLTRAAETAPAVSLVLVTREAVGWMDGAEIAVSALSESAVRDLVEQMLPGAPHEVMAVLVERSGGLPLFVEQCVELLLDDGTIERSPDGCRLVKHSGLQQIPTAMRLFVSARLDRLPESERRVLLTAAVLGDRVEDTLLLALLPGAAAARDAVVQRGLLRWESKEGEVATLRFGHALVREVAYVGQLRTSRRAIHCSAADWYGVLPAREMLEARAKHLRAAVSLGPPDCSLALDAVLAMTHWAQSIVAERPAEAVVVVEEVLDLARRLPACDLPLLETHLTAATGYELVGREEDAEHHAMLAAPLAAAAGDVAAGAQAALLAGRATVLSDPEGARRQLRQAEQRFLAAGDRAGAARTAVELAIALEAQEGLAPVRSAHEQAYRVGVQVGDKRLVSHSAQQLAFFTLLTSRVESEHWSELAAAASRSDDETGRATLMLAEATSLSAALALVQARRAAEDARALARACGADFVYRNATIYALDSSTLLGDLNRAEDLLSELKQIGEGRPNPLVTQNALWAGALLSGRSARPGEADELLARAAAAELATEAAWRRTQLATSAQLWLDRGHWEAAAAAASEAIELDVRLEQPFFTLIPRLLGLRARIAMGQRVSLHEGLALPREADQLGAPDLARVARLWILLDDILRGERDTTLIDVAPDLAEARALEHEISALRDGRPELLLDAAREWSTLGATIWPARALTWHTRLTGEEHPGVADIVASVGADPAVITFFAGQVG